MAAVLLVVSVGRARADEPQPQPPPGADAPTDVKPPAPSTTTPPATTTPPDTKPVPTTGPAKLKPTTAPSPNWFLTGGVIPFLYVSTAVAAGTTLASPPDKPILFSASEGGATPHADTIPAYYVAIFNAGLAGGLAAFDRPARWYHFKGMLESFATTAALNQLAKITFGRHRPSYDPASTNKDDRMSFFSEHSSIMSAGTVYFGLYLHEHVFRPWRGDRVLAWWEVPVYASLATAAIYVPYTRIVDNKHHLSDVIVGGAVGTTSSILFYLYQERRYRGALTGDTVPRVTILPWTSSPGATLAFGF